MSTTNSVREIEPSWLKKSFATWSENALPLEETFFELPTTATKSPKFSAANGSNVFVTCKSEYELAAEIRDYLKKYK